MKHWLKTLLYFSLVFNALAPVKQFSTAELLQAFHHRDCVANELV